MSYSNRGHVRSLFIITHNLKRNTVGHFTVTKERKWRPVLREFISAIKRICKKIKIYVKLKRMDERWYMLNGDCFGLFPPSFYYTHTEDEIKRITAAEIAKLKAILEEYKKKTGKNNNI